MINIFQSLKSKNQYTRQVALKQLGMSLSKHRENTEDIPAKINNHLDRPDIPDSVVIQVINMVLKILMQNNNQIINFLNQIFPILYKKVYKDNKSIEEIDRICETIGELVKIGGQNISQINELYVDRILANFVNDGNFKFENTKYGILKLFIAFARNAPVVVFNKVIENFDTFKKIVQLFKDNKRIIRETLKILINEFFYLLSSRDGRFLIRKLQTRLQQENFRRGLQSIRH